VSSLNYLFLRHAETEVTGRREWHGEQDPPLSSDGRRHALIAAEKLSGLGHQIAAIISSDYCRAVETASLFGTVLNCAIVQDPLLRERDLGRWTGLTPHEIEHAWPGVLDAWRSGRICGPPGGETDDQVSSRVARALLGHANGSVAPKLVIAHAGLLRGLLASNGLPNEEVAPLSGRWLTLQPADAKLVVGEGAAL
jgi:glucosyl-3-phosphoglycerate phosphatase